MRKNNFLLYLVLSFISFECADNSSTNYITNLNTKSNPEPLAIVFILCIPERLDYQNPNVPTFVPLSINTVYGTIFSDPIAEVFRVTIFDTAGNDEYLSQRINQDGSVGFSGGYLGIYNPPRTVNCLVETSVGNFFGVENIPDRLSNLNIVNGDKIYPGDSLKIEWISDSTSFFGVYVYIRYHDTTGSFKHNLDTLLFQESISLPPDLLNRVFESTSTNFLLSINQYNGPLPVAGSHVNMEAGKKGFLYCELSWTSLEFEILNDGSIINIDSSIVHSGQKQSISFDQKIIKRLMGETD